MFAIDRLVNLVRERLWETATCQSRVSTLFGPLHCRRWAVFFLEVSVNAGISEDGTKLNKDESELVEEFRRLSAGNMELVLNNVRAMLASQRNTTRALRGVVETQVTRTEFVA